MKKTSLIVAMLLAGCGGSDSDTPPTPAPTPDAFVTHVKAIVAHSQDDVEAIDIGALDATAPEDSEPEML